MESYDVTYVNKLRVIECQYFATYVIKIAQVSQKWFFDNSEFFLLHDPKKVNWKLNF